MKDFTDILKILLYTASISKYQQEIVLSVVHNNFLRVTILRKIFVRTFLITDRLTTFAFERQF